MSDASACLHFTCSCPIAGFPRPVSIERRSLPVGSGELPAASSAAVYLVEAGEWRPCLDELEQAIPAGQALVREAGSGPLNYRVLDEPCQLIIFQFLGADPVLAELIAQAGDCLPLPAQSQAGRLLRGLLATGNSHAQPGLAEAGRLVTSVLAGLIESTDSRRSHPHSALVRRILERLQDSVHSHASLRDIAQELGISAEHMSRTLREATGRTPMQQLTRLRMQRASMLLRGSDRPIAAIAAETGYKDASHFADVFRRHTGYSPSAYRDSLSAPLL